MGSSSGGGEMTETVTVDALCMRDVNPTLSHYVLDY